MTIDLQQPNMTELKPRITVFGIGGGGGNAVNNMISAGLQGVEFVVANTDAQALSMSKADRRFQLGVSLTQGLGAGACPDVGAEAAKECLDDIIDEIAKCHMIFITAGMGGGTGTGAAPVIAQAARDRGILTIGVVTKPFNFEGARRMKIAEKGIEELQKHVDTLIVIPNQNLFRIATDTTTLTEAFAMADQVLYSGVASVTDLMVKEGMINLDFADVRSVMHQMGRAMMGTGEAKGEQRAKLAAEAAINNPLLDEVSISGARGLLISITGGSDMTLFEVDEAASRIRNEVDNDANVIFGAINDDSLEGCLRVSVVATGIVKPQLDQDKEAQSASSNNQTARGKEGNKANIGAKDGKMLQEGQNSQDAEQQIFASVSFNEFEKVSSFATHSAIDGANDKLADANLANSKENPALKELNHSLKVPSAKPHSLNGGAEASWASLQAAKGDNGLGAANKALKEPALAQDSGQPAGAAGGQSGEMGGASNLDRAYIAQRTDLQNSLAFAVKEQEDGAQQAGATAPGSPELGAPEDQELGQFSASQDYLAQKRAYLQAEISSLFPLSDKEKLDYFPEPARRAYLTRAEQGKSRTKGARSFWEKLKTSFSFESAPLNQEEDIISAKDHFAQQASSDKAATGKGPPAAGLSAASDFAKPATVSRAYLKDAKAVSDSDGKEQFEIPSFLRRRAN